MNDGPVFYDGELPVSDEWIAENAGRLAHIRFVVELDIIIDANGIEDMNDYCDAATGVVLTDLSFHIAPWDDQDAPSDQSLLIEARGTVEPTW